jgi:hypothetical protein
MLLVGVLGVLGNLATLVTVPYAVRQKRHGLHKNFYNSTIFILNLSFTDLCHCLCFVLPQGILYFCEHSPFGGFGCLIIMSGCVLSVTCDMLAMALISLSRYLDISYKEKWNQICDLKKNVMLLLALFWTPGLLSIPLLIFIYSHDSVKPGWDCRYGACGFLQSYDVGMHPKAIEDIETTNYNSWNLMYIYTIFVPLFSFVVMIVCYLFIWRKVHKSAKYLSGTESMMRTLNKREFKMTKAISIIILCSFLCWLPLPILAFVFLTFSDSHHVSSDSDYILYAIIQSVFVSQYALNFFIYITQSEQFRDAFLDGIHLFRRQESIMQTRSKKSMSK